MALVDWDSSLATGDHEIDTQHKKLFTMINELHDSMMKGRGRDVVGEVLQGLVEYTVDHFAAEEAVMEAHAFPEFARHRGLHAGLTRQVQNLSVRAVRGDAMLSLEVSQFLSDWLKSHILDEDIEMVRFIRSRN